MHRGHRGHSWRLKQRNLALSEMSEKLCCYNQNCDIGKAIEHRTWAVGGWELVDGRHI